MTPLAHEASGGTATPRDPVLFASLPTMTHLHPALPALRRCASWRHTLSILAVASLAACGGGGGGDADAGAAAPLTTTIETTPAKTVPIVEAPAIPEAPVAADENRVEIGEGAPLETALAVTAPTGSIWTRVADEGGSVTFPWGRYVRYGTDGAWITRAASGTMRCTNAFFGSDPAPGKYKRCETTTTWTKAADEKGGFTLSSPRRVRFGVGSDWIIRTVSGWVPCTTAFFSEPRPNVAKTCEVEWTPVPTANLSQLGIYTGNQPTDLTRFEGWMGRTTDGTHVGTAVTSWADMVNSAIWSAGLWENSGRSVYWSAPMLVYNATLEQAAAGAYDASYRRLAEVLVGFRSQEARLNVRIGWEFNGSWFNWNAQKGRHPLYIATYRRMVTIFRQVAAERGVPNRFQFEWNVAIGAGGMNPADAYPGDDVVDVIGGDFYWDPKWDPVDPNAAFDHMLRRPYGLMWHQTFAASHGKPTSYSEWGVKSDNAGPYIQRARDWFTQHHVLFHNYWDSQAVYPGMLSNGQYPNAGAAFRDAFKR
jgi:hypothetical protein